MVVNELHKGFFLHIECLQGYPTDFGVIAVVVILVIHKLGGNDDGGEQ